MSQAPRFTLDGGPALEERLTRLCDEVLERVRATVPEQHFEGLLLGGGYGRGEGGVLRVADKEEPYNDLEFYVFIRGAVARRFAPALHRLARELHARAGVEVEFKPMARAKLERSPPSMFYYDLVVGHRRLWGGEELLAGCARHRDAGAIPLTEATRLLMNRCSGLLFSLAKLKAADFTSDDADFVARNHAKAQLAFGDAILTAEGQYHWSCRERHRRLGALAAAGASLLAEALPHHACGVEFKLHPVRSNAARKDLLAQHARLSAFARAAWLWLESRRLGRSFDTVFAYAADRAPKLPRRAARNVLLNVVVFGPGAVARPKLFRDPRERLLESLPLLLWEMETPAGGPRLELAQSRLCTEASQFPELVDAYTRLWKQFN